MTGTRGQSTLEFVFAMVAVMALIYGTAQVFRWVGMDAAQRRWAADAVLDQAITSGNAEKLSQDLYHRPARINAFLNMGMQ